MSRWGRIVTMVRIPRNQATGLEVLATFVGLGVFIGLIPIELRLISPQFVNQFSLMPMAAGGFVLTYLIMAVPMPTWGIVGLEHFRLRRQAEWYAQWWAVRHPLMEQRIECALRAAYLALNRGDQGAAMRYAEMGLAIAGVGIDRPVISFYYALCLTVRASFYQNAGRYQEALEDYARATRLNLKPSSLTAQYYAQASCVLYDLGRFDDTVLFAQQAILPGDCPTEHLVAAYRSAALALAEQERYAEAVAQSRAGLNVHPYSWASALLTADHYWLLTMAGEEEEAAVQRAKLEAIMMKEGPARLLRPEYQEVLARIAMAQGNWTKAEELFRESMQQTTHQSAQCY